MLTTKLQAHSGHTSRPSTASSPPALPGPCCCPRRAAQRAALRLRPCSAAAAQPQPESSNNRGPEASSSNNPGSQPSFVQQLRQVWKDAWEEPLPGPEEEAERLRSEQERIQQLRQQLKERLSWQQQKQQQQQQQQGTQQASQATTTAPQPQQRGKATAPGQRPFFTWALVAWVWVLFALQWAPLASALFDQLAGPADCALRLAAVGLVVPDSPAAWAWQMDALGWLRNGIGSAWPSALRSAFLFGGLLPTWLFSKGLLEAGSILESAWSPLVLALHAATCALAAGAAQVFMGPGTPATITGPAVVCGLCLAVVGHSAKAVAGVSARESLSLAEEAAALAAGMSSTGPTRSAPAPAAGGQEGSAAGAAAAAAAATVGGAASGGKAAQPRAAAKSLRELIAQAALQGKAPLWVLSLTNTSMACLAAGFLFGAYEPMLGVWGVVGGCMGGLLAPTTSIWLVLGIRYSASALVRAVLVLLQLPRLLLQGLLAGGAALWRATQETMSSLRRVL